MWEGICLLYANFRNLCYYKDMSEKSLQQKKNSGNGFLAQAGILAVAGIISRIIGLLYRSPLAGVIGDLGLGYYGAAYTYYTIVLLVSSYSIPSAISKVIAQKLALQEYRNAHRLFYGAFGYVLVIGGIGSLFLFFGAGLFVEPAAIPVLRLFAPTVFVYGILGVLRGYFQAHRSMVQTSVSQVLEQIANAIVSVGAAYLLIKIMCGTMEIPTQESAQITRAVYGAMGSAMGTGCGVLVALVFMVGAYLKHRKDILQKIAQDTHEEVDSVLGIIKTITFIVTPFILSTAIYNLSASVNTKIYTDIYPSMRALRSVDITSRWGVFSGKALTISNIPIAFASAMAAAMIPSVAQLIAAKEMDTAKEKIGLAVRATMLISIPCAVGIFVLAAPITLLLFPDTSAQMLPLAQRTLMALSISVIFYALSTLNSSILQGLGKVNTPIVNAAIALALQTITAVLLLFFTNLDLYSIAIANTVYAALMAVLNQLATRRAIGYEQEKKRTFVIPLCASCGMALVAWGIYRGGMLLGWAARSAVIPAVLVAIPVYALLLLAFKGISKEELLAMPKGALLVRILSKFHLM